MGKGSRRRHELIGHDKTQKNWNKIFPATKEKQQNRKAGPELLREDLRALPSDLVTKDIAEDGKVHELDDPHIQEDYIEKYYDKENEKAPDQDRMTALIAKLQGELGGGSKLNQAKVDIVRFRVIRALMERPPEELEKKRWLKFPEDNIDIYELKEGNPPSDVLRKKHMKGLELHIDCFDWPQRIIDILEANGIMDTFAELTESIERSQSDLIIH